MGKFLSTGHIQTICRIIVESVHPVKVILFGSYATGTATGDSDIDFLVVTKAPLKKKLISSQISRLLPTEFDLVSMDVIAIGIEEFEETKEVIGGLAYPASKYGRVLYENP